ncbi:hypothetical protein CDIK_2174 [Cucumispora dikerogammari]|nr:hypothetical protein CDIK_2174 [Cucumispora dikerogammari]
MFRFSNLIINSLLSNIRLQNIESSEIEKEHITIKMTDLVKDLSERERKLTDEECGESWGEEDNIQKIYRFPLPSMFSIDSHDFKFTLPTSLTLLLIPLFKIKEYQIPEKKKILDCLMEYNFIELTYQRDILTEADFFSVIEYSVVESIKINGEELNSKQKKESTKYRSAFFIFPYGVSLDLFLYVTVFLNDIQGARGSKLNAFYNQVLQQSSSKPNENFSFEILVCIVELIKGIGLDMKPSKEEPFYDYTLNLCVIDNKRKRKRTKNAKKNQETLEKLKVKLTQQTGEQGDICFVVEKELEDGQKIEGHIGIECGASRR